MAGMLSGMFGGGAASAAPAASAAAPSGGFGIGDAGTAVGSSLLNSSGGFEDMFAGKSPYDIPSPAQPSGMGKGGQSGQGLLEMLSGMSGSGRGGVCVQPGFQSGRGTEIPLQGLRAMGNRHQARNNSARQAYRAGLLGG